MLTWAPSFEDRPLAIDGLQAVDDTRRFWEGWASGIDYTGRWQGAVRRSLVTLSAISLLLLAKGEIGQMTELVEEGIAEAASVEDEKMLNFLLIQRGYAATFRGDLDTGEEALSEALAVLRDRGGRWGTAPVLNALSQVELSRGDFATATEFLREGEAVSRETEDAFTLATNLNIQATISQLEGDEERTKAVPQESVSLSSALRDSWALVYGLVGLAGIAARHAEPERAARLFGAAEALTENT